MLTLRNVSYNFGSHWALKNVSFTLGKGEFLFLTGPSGSGKTSLMRLLYGALPLTRGEACVAGFNLRALKPSGLPMLRRQIGVVFQDFKVLETRTVFANVALALEVRGMKRALIDRRVRAVLRALHMEDKGQALCGELSGGEQQRVAIARAVVINPKLILADEPTGNLDPGLSSRLMDVFRQFHSYGATIVMATHNPQTVRAIPDAKILRLKYGVVDAANWDLEHDGDGKVPDLPPPPPKLGVFGGLLGRRRG